MDKKYEEIIIKNFFSKRIQERVIYELASPKKRIDALSRLCHNYDNVLIHKYMIEIPKPNSDYIDIRDILKSYGAKDTCYAISFNKDIDGQYLPLKSALEKAVGLGMASIISCIPNQLLYFESEQSYGPPARFILIKD